MIGSFVVIMILYIYIGSALAKSMSLTRNLVWATGGGADYREGGSGGAPGDGGRRTGAADMFLDLVIARTLAGEGLWDSKGFGGVAAVLVCR